jgi:two-component system CheB/CheR fusion protein
MSDDPARPSSLPTPPEPQAVAPSALPRAVVGIGGSAGALDSYERFFLGLPPGSGLGFVVVSHLNPDGHSLMPDLLRRCTPLPVLQIGDGMPVLPDHVYVIPSGVSLLIENGTLLLRDLETAQGRTIDTFLTSLAADQGERAIAVILSGMGDDGSRGVQAVKTHSGRVLTQDPLTADYPSMPASALVTGTVDWVLPPDELAPRLYELATHASLLQTDPEAVSAAELQKVLRLVRERTGQDFSQYKPATLLRRIDRRMKGQRLDTLSQYLAHLERSPDEVDALFDDLTINVTSFFRDPEAFDQLKAELRRSLRRPERDWQAVRAWVVGCASGEEAYSIAMVLHELTQEPDWSGPMTIQVFATDIDPNSLRQARQGLYPRSTAQVMSPERLQRYFMESEDGYQVSDALRSMIVFAQHNTFGAPPFTSLDLLCCRNMLIYLNAELQKRILMVSHYALRPGGVLFLGASETIDASDERFEILNARWRIYRRGTAAAGTLPVETLLQGVNRTGVPSQRPLAGRPARTSALPQDVQRLLVATYAPPAVVVNAQGEILYVNGRTGRYLELPSVSEGRNNVLNMVGDGLRFELASALRRVVREGRLIILRDVQHREGEGPLVLDVTVRPLPVPTGEGEHTLLITFEERPADLSLPEVTPEQVDQVQALTREMHHQRETSQAMLEEYIIATEELRTTNEEYQTTIEELQSTNEELLTSKEELQSLNEELITTNAEHRSIIHDVTLANDDMKNLLESAGIATLFLDNDLRIKRFTPMITAVIHLIQTDVARHISDINLRLRDVDLVGHVTGVLETLLPFEAQVQTIEGQWYLMRITPYRTSENYIDGVIVTFIDIGTVKALEVKLDHSALYAESLLNTILIPMVVLNDDLRLVTANRAFYELLRLSPEQAVGQRLRDLGGRQFDQWELQERLRGMVLTDAPLTQYIVDLDVPGAGWQKTKVEAWPVLSPDRMEVLHLMVVENVTSVVHRAAQEGEAFTGDAEESEPES